MTRLLPFSADFRFRDGIRASACGLCTAQPDRIVRALSGLSESAFGVWEDGLLIDHRFSRLLGEALRGLPVVLLGGCVCAAAKDGPCGAVLGEPGSAPESAGNNVVSLSLGERDGFVLLRPGCGALALFAPSAARETLLGEALRNFPQRQFLERLDRETDGGLWALDYDPARPDASTCRVWWKRT